MATILYKYKSLNDQNHIEDILKFERLFFSDLSVLNDPTEAILNRSPYIDTWGLIDDLEEFDNPKPFIFCLSQATKRENRNLMWAHYADSFKGICIRFKYSQPRNQKLILSKINSLKEDQLKNFRHMQGENLSRSKNDLGIADGISKEKYWANEEECRFISFKAGIPTEYGHYHNLRSLGLEIECIEYTDRTKSHANFNFLKEICRTQKLCMSEYSYLWI